MIDSQRLLTVVIEAGTFISAFAAIVGALVMWQVRKKFGTGILATGFKVIAIGVLLIAGGILMEAVKSYLLIARSDLGAVGVVLSIIEELLFIAGTYTIVIGSKKTGDKLESLTN